MNKIILYLVILFLLYICFVSSNTFDNSVHKLKLYDFIDDNYKLKTYNYNELDKIIYPCIVKPIYCSGRNINVKKINNRNDLNFILKNNKEYMIQDFYNSKYEAGLLYERIPFFNTGKIISIVLKKKDYMWQPLKCGNVKNNESTICINMDELITDKLTKKINNICLKIPYFYVGRFDIGFDDINELKNGLNFKIYELNGNMGFDLRTNITKNDGKKIYKMILILRFVFTRILIGLINIVYNKKIFINNIVCTKKRFDNCKLCQDWELIFSPSVA